MYEVISKYYDLFMDERKPWVEFAVEAVKTKGRGADVGCGSGDVALALSASHRLVAIDSSPQMLEACARKFRSHGLVIPTVLQKAEKLQLSFKAEFITAMCDVVNYIKTPSKFFKAAYDNLQVDGLLVFDISSKTKLVQTLGNNVYTQTKDDVTYVWENELNGTAVDMTLTFFVPDGNGRYEKLVDEQRQYIHDEADIVNQLNLCGFNAKTYDRGDRIYFIANKVK